MVSLLTAAFWISSLAVIYPYAIYPFMLRGLVLLRCAKRGIPPSSAPPSRVSLVISAFNEADTIGLKLENTLALEFPSRDLEIIVASDASNDATDDIVRDAAKKDDRVRLLRQTERRGKSAALNMAVGAARGDIVVFSDANAMYDPGAVRELVAGFADPTVGYVVGAAHYCDANGRPAAENEGFYWKLELYLKGLESQWGNVVGGDGAIYAIRRHLFEQLEDDDISDFVNPMQVVAAGYRGTFNAAARCYEHAGDTVTKEFKRKRRIVNRSWRAVRRYAPRLRIRQHGRFLFMLWSHKVLRWYALPFIALAWLTNTALLGQGRLYVCTWILFNATIVGSIVCALLYEWGRRPPRLLSLMHYFYVINLAGFLGMWDEYRGVRHVTWDHIRKTER